MKKSLRKLQDERMIITITGKPGSGKSTIARMLARHYGLRHYSAGGIQREIAKKRGINLLELSLIEENDRSLDAGVDKRIEELGKREDDFVIDGRLAFHFIPRSIKIFLDVSLDESTRRIFRSRRLDERENTTFEKTKRNIKRRMHSEVRRFKKYYGLNLTDKKNYDIVINTTNLSINEVFNAVKKAINEKFKV